MYSRIYTHCMNDFSHYPNFQKFLNKKILAIDFGTKVIGTAMFCPGRDPFPYMAEKIIYKSDKESILTLKNVIANEDIDVIVIGIPYYLDGKESQNTIKIRSFGQIIKNTFINQDFYEQDETLTTKTAENRMKNSPEFNFKVDPTRIDCLCATIILEDFIRA